MGEVKPLKCLSDESLVIPLEELRVDDKFHFVYQAVEVMDQEIKQLKRSRIHIIKVNKVQVRDTLDDCLLMSYCHKDLRALHFGDFVMFQAEDQPYTEDASPTAELPGYIADSDPMKDDIDADSIDCPDEPGTNDEDEDPEEDPNEEHEPDN
ncbi:hypothetical protein Tco_0357453 [Tanacetum coccineum]